MAWTIEYTGTALKQLKKLDRQAAAKIVAYLRTRVASQDDPKTAGKPLQGPLGGLWRYRVEDYRIICEIREKEVRILVVMVGHRSRVYRD